VAEHASIVKDMNAAMEAYMAAYSNHDVQRIREHVTSKFLVLGPNPAEFTSEDDYARAIGGLKKSGWDRSHVEILESHPLSEDHGLMVVNVLRFTGDGSELNKSRLIYFAQRVDDVWRISGSIPVSPPFTGPGNHPLP
jgi:ketosteroid isomerase-like protein